MHDGAYRTRTISSWTLLFISEGWAERKRALSIVSVCPLPPLIESAELNNNVCYACEVELNIKLNIDNIKLYYKTTTFSKSPHKFI